MSEKQKIYLVWNKAKNECVGFLDKRDAIYTATGVKNGMSCTPTIGDDFRENYADSKRTKLPMTEVEL